MPYLGVRPADITSATEAEIAGDLTVDTNTLVVDAANNRVGVGTSTVDSALHIEQNASGVTETSGSTVKIHNTNASGRSKISLHNSAETASGSIYYDTDSGMLALQGDTGAGVAFHTGGNTEAMRIEPSYGRLLINRTSASTVGPYSKLHVLGDSAVDVVTLQVGTNGYSALVFLNASGAYSGGITVSSGSVSYNTASDYRLKENVADMTGAIDRVKQLAPKRFNFIVDADTTVDGFLAHEAQTVVPEAITGTYNQVETWIQQEIDDGDAPDGTSAGDNKLDEDGNTIPVMQGIDQAKLVPLLTAALKESIAKIETLETEMTALKARVTALENA